MPGFFYLVLFIAGADCLILQSSTPSRDDPCEAVREFLPLRGNELVATLRRAIDIIERTPSMRRTRRPSPYENNARHILHFLTQDPSYIDPDSSPDTSPTKKPRSEDTEFCLPSSSFGTGRRTSLETMRRIVALDNSGKSEASIRAQYKWYNRKYLADFKQCVEAGGSRTMLRSDLETWLVERIRDLRRRRLPVRGYTIRAMARRRAIEIGAQWFMAGSNWLDYFKKRMKIKSLKVTKSCGRPEMINAERIQESIEEFRRNYPRYSKFFRRQTILNTDQTGVEYESSNRRTLEFSGTRDVHMMIDSLNKNTHSYTAQPILSRSGRLEGKLALCMQETNGEFGPIVGPRVRELEERYGNIRVYASKSGKMTSELMHRWLKEVLVRVAADLLDRSGEEEWVPYPENYDEADRRCISDLEQLTTQRCRSQSWFRLIFNLDDEDCIDTYQLLASNACKVPYVLLLSDSWSGQSSREMQLSSRLAGAKPLTIPPSTTGQLQPLDVGFFLQFKRFLRRLTEEALINGRVSEITSREGIINFMSLLYNQLQSPAYHDIWRYAWRHTDPDFSLDELTNNPPANVNSIQFSFDPAESCSVDNCTEHAVVRCSHCGRILCLTHFLNRTCFHEIDDHDSDIASLHPFGPPDLQDDIIDMEDEEELFFMDDMPRISTLSPTSSTTPDPLMQQIAGQCSC